MLVGSEFWRHSPGTELQLTMVRGVLQGSSKRRSKRSRTETAGVRQLTGLSGPKPIHHPTRGVAHRRQSDRSRFDPDEAKWFGP